MLDMMDAIARELRMVHGYTEEGARMAVRSGSYEILIRLAADGHRAIQDDRWTVAETVAQVIADYDTFYRRFR